MSKACRFIEECEEEPSLEALAEAVGQSPSYFHRLFKAFTGLTPKDYAETLKGLTSSIIPRKCRLDVAVQVADCK